MKGSQLCAITLKAAWGLVFPPVILEKLLDNQGWHVLRLFPDGTGRDGTDGTGRDGMGGQGWESRCGVSASSGASSTVILHPPNP